MVHSKRIIILLILCVFIFLQFVAIRKMVRKSQSQNLNFLLITVDALPANHMGIYGYTKNTTPNMDKFAEESVLFTRAYTIFPETVPSLFTLFTGGEDVLQEEMITRGLIKKDNRRDIVTLPEILKKNNFLTAAFVMNPVVGSNNLFFRRGFEQFNFFNESGLSDFRKVYKDDYRNSEVLTTKAKNWLAKNSRTRFFLWIHYSTPHMPYNPSLKYLCKIDQECDITKYEELLKGKLSYSTLLKSCPDTEISEETVGLAKNLFDAEILSVDEKVGEILQAIKGKNLYEKTVIMIVGVHGESFTHNTFGHVSGLYESNIKVPLIMKNPLSKSPKRIPRLTDNMAILPTILDLLEITYAEKQFSGKSLVPNFGVFGNFPFNFRNKYLYFLTSLNKSNKYALFDGTYKYIFSNANRCLYKGYKEELYNIHIDPQEEKNLIDEKPEVAKRLKTSLFGY